MTPEPLKKKLVYYELESSGEFVPDYFHYSDLKSSVSGLIKFHEDKIEKLIKEWKSIEYSISINPFEHDIVYSDLIQREYESIMAIEHWLEDVI